ncbi:cyclic nucleotide-binding/CBS domain-containing protein [candidate division KSB1 bacterium]
MVKVRNIIEGKKIICIQQNETVQTAVEMLVTNNVGAIIVLNGEQLVGIFSERDLLSRVVYKKLNPVEVMIKDVMTTHLVVADGSETLQDALQKLQQINARHLPVVDKDKLVGIVSMRSLLSADVKKKEEEIKWLNAYIHYVPPGKE